MLTHLLSLVLHLPAVGKVDERLHGVRVHHLDGDLLLPALGHVVGEHGVEVGHGGGEDDAVRVVKVLADLEILI